MRLYHHPFSSNARRAVMTALHLDVPVELVFVDLPKREHLQPQFSHRTWISGSSLTLADLAIAAPLGHTVHAQLPVAQYAHLQKWFARVQGLEAWKKTAI